MALAPFFDRIYSAIGGHLSVSRDDLAASLEGVTVGIKFALPLSGNDLWIAELATNLLARLYPRMAITGPEQDRLRLRTLALKINPEIEAAWLKLAEEWLKGCRNCRSNINETARGKIGLFEGAHYQASNPQKRVGTAGDGFARPEGSVVGTAPFEVQATDLQGRRRRSGSRERRVNRRNRRPIATSGIRSGQPFHAP